MQDINKVLETLHPLERKVFPLLEKDSDFSKLVKNSGLEEIEVLRALQWLQNKKLIILKTEVKEMLNLAKNGEKYKKHKMPERRLLEALDKGSESINEIVKSGKVEKDEANICIGMLKKKNAVDINKDSTGLVLSLTDEGEKLLKSKFDEEKILEKDMPVDIKKLNDEEQKIVKDMLKRKELVSVELIKIREASLTDEGKRGLKSGVSMENVLDRVTPELLKSGEWKDKKFRSYDIKAPVSKVFGGRRHFMNEAIDYVKKIWMDLGFKEMSGNIVQSSFWNFDALFTAQDHPARDLQDTFFIKDPALAKLPSKYANKEIIKRLKETHENGWKTGSDGWDYKWKIEDALKNVLRTHTTVLSAQTLAKLKEEDMPAKFFSIGTVFRNETLDWSHLFEFHQTDCIVVDPNANFKHLLGYLKEFFKKMGYDRIRIRPAYFPYTEPSVEVEVFHPVHKKWIELGGAGVFRPEVVMPLLGKDVPVLAWGLGFGRIISEYYSITDIRDLYKNDLKQIREAKAWLK
jgi:phenylalanyl-tRNA synthetase alpha chain